MRVCEAGGVFGRLREAAKLREVLVVLLVLMLEKQAFIAKLACLDCRSCVNGRNLLAFVIECILAGPNTEQG